ncbi:MAG: hypothetical protein Tsb0014_13630 [Pleurocapsa sp.]
MKSTIVDSKEFQNSPESSVQCREFFNQKWTLYQKVLANNYMGHRQMYQILNQFLISYQQKPFKFLDLGCGDSSFIAEALVNTNVVDYLGVDLSDIALSIANSNMDRVGCEKQFMSGDFRELVPLLVNNQNYQFDVILASFAFHHLTLEQKDDIFQQLHQLLNPGGVFLLIDIVAKEGENRETYIQRYLDDVNRKWLQLTLGEIAIVSHHMLEHDFPESETTLKSLAQKYGFQKEICLYKDAWETARLLCFYR